MKIKIAKRTFTLTAEQRDALLAYAEEKGRNWKQRLSLDWEFARASIGGVISGDLQRIRNTFGPTWLARTSLNQIKAAACDMPEKESA